MEEQENEEHASTIDTSSTEVRFEGYNVEFDVKIKLIPVQLNEKK